ncbi:hypothetical protein OV090_39475 [Nannocystis sp. RBIL2]|uniref:hypothetical protein n=1 Tax=Nannocystis sp. RBIL2 TaxID=2996788 RepID=UPI002270F432|nr:hypothetical protein [Nannocystis sp. RBIL2]MCY1070888.1 hypothetical protein [Nannocystis sp. RBIL2]
MTEETCLEGQPPRAAAPTCPEGHAATPGPEQPFLASASTCPEGHAAGPAEATRPADHAAAPVSPTLAHLTPLRGGLSAVLRAMSPEKCPNGHPRPAIPAVLRTAALICWAALAGACGDRSGDPVRAAQAFTAAVQRGDMNAVYPLLERAATERLTAAAAQASDQVGGRRRIEPAEMLQIVDVDPNFELASAELVGDADPSEAKDGELAQVRLLGSQQESHTLTLVREEGAWRVRIPLPPLTPTATTP